MSDNLMFSVVIPAYNCARYLAQALESVFSQTEPAGEIIIVDDGSTDNTKEVAASFAGRIKYIYQENAGPAAARNRGVEDAKGEWIAFLDGDDAWLPWRISVAAKLIANNPGAVLFCGRWVDISADPQPPCASDLNKIRVLSLRELAESNPVGTSTVIMRRDIFMRLGGFDPVFRGLEDYDLWMRAAKDHLLVYADIPLSRYRFILGSLSMDGRLFLPQGIRLFNKAFGEGGVLSGYVDQKPKALAKLYISVSWMAFQHGSRGAALRYLLSALLLDMHSWIIRGIGIKLFLRYIFGKR